MKRIITLVSALALMLSFSSGVASANLDDLEAALIAAQEAVDAIEQEIEELEEYLVVAQGELEEATADRDAQQRIVDDLEAELEEAEQALAEAREILQDLVELRAACDDLATNQLRNACRNPTNPAYNAAVADVTTKEALRDDAQDEVDEATAELERLQGIVDDKQEAVDGLEAAIEGKQRELAEAEEIRDVAQKAIDDYVAPIEAKHAGCKGIENAQQQVAKSTNGKGKAAEALATVAVKLDCAA